MPYVKPGVEVKQVQRTATPILSSPELTATILGRAYWWQDPSWEDAADPLRNSVSSSVYYDNAAQDYNMSGINASYHDLLDADLCCVDLVVSAGIGAGTVLHLSKAGGEFTVNTSSNTVTLVSGILGNRGLGTAAIAKFGYLAAKDDVESQYKTLSSINDIQDQLGEPMSFNNLAFGALVAMGNAGSAVSVLAAEGNASTDYDALLDILETKDTYAIAPMSHKVTDGNFKTHVEAQSEPEMKKERLAFLNPEATFQGGNRFTEPSSDKTTSVASMRDAHSAVGSKRIFNVHPDVCYVEETRHISTVHPTFVKDSFDDHSDVLDGSFTSECLFSSDTTMGTTNYKSGDPITEAIHSGLSVGGWGGGDGQVTVLAPVPGYAYCAANAGAVIGKSPEQPLTNVAIAGIKQTKGSADYYSESQLNTLAEGGCYIMNQVNDIAPIVCRHQMSTDVTSIAKRELSVTTALDYTAKFLRKALNPYVGKNTISPAFLKLVNTVLVGVGLWLVREGILNDFTVASVVQDDINPDTLRVEVNVLVKYPVNYIKITLVF